MQAFIRNFLILGGALLLALGAQAQAQAQAQDSAVYHLDNSEAQATKALRNIRNHLDVAPLTRIVVVSHAEGIDFLMEGARDRKNADIDYASLVSALKARGVRFEVCEITLASRRIAKDKFIMDADFTPSGVARIGQLQSREKFAYIKP